MGGGQGQRQGLAEQGILLLLPLLLLLLLLFLLLLLLLLSNFGSLLFCGLAKSESRGTERTDRL